MLFFCDWAVEMQISALLTRNICIFSHTQVTVKACGSLVWSQFEKGRGYKKCFGAND